MEISIILRISIAWSGALLSKDKLYNNQYDYIKERT